MRDYENVRERLLFYARNAVDDDVTKDLTDAADAIESLLAENAFLKKMQRQLVDGVPLEDLGHMVSNALPHKRR